jgi:hypothetical protein
MHAGRRLAVERQRGMLQVVDVRSSKRGCGGRHGRWQVLDVRKKKQERLRWQARAVAGGRCEKQKARAAAVAGTGGGRW